MQFIPEGAKLDEFLDASQFLRSSHFNRLQRVALTRDCQWYTAWRWGRHLAMQYAPKVELFVYLSSTWVGLRTLPHGQSKVLWPYFFILFYRVGKKFVEKYCYFYYFYSDKNIIFNFLLINLIFFCKQIIIKYLLKLI